MFSSSSLFACFFIYRGEVNFTLIQTLGNISCRFCVYYLIAAFIANSAGHLLTFKAICKCIMRAVIQRVSQASVVVNETTKERDF